MLIHVKGYMGQLVSIVAAHVTHFAEVSYACVKDEPLLDIFVTGRDTPIRIHSTKEDFIAKYEAANAPRVAHVHH